MPPAAPPHPHKLFGNLAREHGFEAAFGPVLEGLRGTLYRNGIGAMEMFGSRYSHLFEADGAISAFRFGESGLSTAARLVQSQGLIEEMAAGRHLASHAASWPHRLIRAWKGTFKNTANTHVVPYQRELLALMEGGHPTRIDPDSLLTLGETDLNSVVVGTFSAHPHRVASRATTYNFGMSYGRQVELCIYELPDQGTASMLCRVPLRHAFMVHDFAVTERYAVFFLCPMRLRMWRYLLGLRGFEKNVSWTPELGTEVVVVPLDAPEKIVRFHVDPFYTFHFAGAYEEKEEIVVDYVRYADGRLLDALGDGSGLSWKESEATPPGLLYRARINLEQRTMREENRADFRCEFPRIATSTEGCPFDHLWLQSEIYSEGLLRQQITRIDASGRTVHHTLDLGQLCSEPVVVEQARPGRGIASILTIVFDAFKERSEILALQPETLDVQMRWSLPQVVPLTFHGTWVPSSPVE